MRLAILAASAYSKNQKLPELLHIGQHVELFSQRVAEPDAGFQVHVFAAERGLADKVEQLLDALEEPIDALLFYFAGYAFVSDERGAALLLDGERLSTLSLRRMERWFSQRSPASFVVLDTVTAFDEERDANDVVQMLGVGLANAESRIHRLVANRPTGDGASPFSSLLALVLDWQSGTQGLSPAELYVAMRAEESLFENIASAQFFAADTPFDVLVPREEQPFSLPPAAPALSPEEAESRADALAQAGDFQSALAEYAVALEQAGTPSQDRHPALYSKIGATLRAVGRETDGLAYYEAALDLDRDWLPALRGAADLFVMAGNHVLALTLFQRWLALEPNALVAAESAAKLLADAKRWDDLASLYEFVLSKVTEPETAVKFALELATLCRDLLGNPGRAAAALERAASLAPDDPRVRLLLVELCDKREDFTVALNHVVLALRADPGHVDGYRTALRLFEKCGRADGAWNAACALEVLGEADVNESLLAGAHKPSGLLPARASVNDRDWASKVFCPERDDRIDEIFRILGDAAFEVGLETARRKRRLAVLDPAMEQDPSTSTATLAKTLFWAARLLGVNVPKLYVLPDLDTTFSAPAHREGVLLVQKSLASGLGLSELAFLWGRQLAYFRPEHRLPLFFTDVDELEALLVSALSLGGVADFPWKKLDGDAKLFGRGLKRHFSKDSLARLQPVASAFPRRNSRASLAAWSRAVELAAGRAGLLCSGDLELAAKLTRAFPISGLVTVEDQVRDLLAYALSNEYLALRERLGVNVRS